jgi:hypothetical protein
MVGVATMRERMQWEKEMRNSRGSNSLEMRD